MGFRKFTGAKGLDKVLMNLKSWEEETVELINDFNVQTAGQAKSKARQDAPWNNITGNARQGLDSDTDWQQTLMIITLFHSVIYGKYLELSNDGKNAILEKTLNELRTEWQKGVKRILNRPMSGKVVAGEIDFLRKLMPI